MGVILVTGISDSGKDSILEMVLTGSEKNLPDFEYMDFDSLFTHDVDKDSEEIDLWSFDRRIEHMHRIQKDFHTNLRKKTEQLSKTGNHIIVNGYFTLKTPGGFLPTLTDESVKFFKPDVIIVISVDLDGPELLKKFGKEKIRELKDHQEMNLKYAVTYSEMCRSSISVINVEYGNLKEALRETIDAIMLAVK